MMMGKTQQQGVVNVILNSSCHVSRRDDAVMNFVSVGNRVANQLEYALGFAG